jgi:cell wall-associated NlpC family hydrolase
MVARLCVAALLVVPLSVGFATSSLARPSRADLAAARAKLDAMNRHLSLLVEEYDQTTIKLQAAQQQLQDARAAAGIAQAQAGQAQAELSARAVAAYEGAGSEIDVLLGSTSLSEFSDRLEFLGAMARKDADAATQAEVKRQEALRAAQLLATAVRERTSLLAALDAKKRQIIAGIAQQQALVRQIQGSLAQQAAAAAAARAASRAPRPPGPGDPGGPRPPSRGAGAALRAAYSVIGAPYKWGGADPKTGFDCSGLTMWSWAHAGVSLPHSAAMQYAAIPHVSRSALLPGDLLFFYTPISHVGMYVGGGQMIDSSHPGVGVRVHAVYWQYFVGAGRPVS